jgi:POT family proton-dependent oligopeptide transporter
MPPSMVQIFNGLFVVMLAIPFSMLWDALRKKGKEPLSPVKQAVGLLLIAISYFIIAHNVKYLGTSGLLAVKWLILLYLIQTLGELCLSPIGLSLVGKLSPKRFASLLYGVFFLSNASGYALAGTLGSILPPTSEKYIEADKRHIDLHAILEGTKKPTGAELFTLAQIKVGKINETLAKENNLDFKTKYTNIVKLNAERDEAKKQGVEFVNKFSAQDTAFTPQEYQLIADKNIVTIKYPKFAGFVIKDLFDFFMVFVVLCGVASGILFALTPLLKKMMHGVR